MDVESEINSIKERNRRVEADKAWETSWFRQVLIMAITYPAAGIIFLAIGNDHPWRNAWIPTIAYFLSTQSLPFIKERWIYKRIKHHD